MENNQTQNLPKTHRKPSTIQTNYQKTLRKILKEKNIRTELDQEILDTDNKRVMSITIYHLFLRLPTVAGLAPTFSDTSLFENSSVENS